MRALLDKADRTLVLRILEIDPASVADRFKRRRLQRLLDNLRDINGQLAGQFDARLRRELEAVGAAEAGFQGRNFSRILDPAGVSFTVISPEKVQAAAMARPFQSVHLRWATVGQHDSELFRRRGQMLRDTVRQGVVLGDSIGDLVRRIRGTAALNFRDGILEVSRRTAETIARTAVNHTLNVARQLQYEANSDIVNGLRWLATLDSRTCPICAGRDLQSSKVPFRIDAGPRPPAHPNCRCVMVPLLGSFKDLGLDVEDAPGLKAFKGDNPGEESFQRWLRRQPAGIQNEALGVTKGKLFRQGGLEVDRFVNRAGREFTLDDLRRREPEAFVAAGLD